MYALYIMCRRLFYSPVFMYACMSCRSAEDTGQLDIPGMGKLHKNTAQLHTNIICTFVALYYNAGHILFPQLPLSAKVANVILQYCDCCERCVQYISIIYVHVFLRSLLFATSFFLSISEKCSYIRDCSCIYTHVSCFV